MSPELREALRGAREFALGAVLGLVAACAVVALLLTLGVDLGAP